MKSIFYNGQDFNDKKTISIKKFFDLDFGEPDLITVLRFSSSEGFFNICYRSNKPLFITKVVDTSHSIDFFNTQHSTFIKELGVIVEVLNPGIFENIQYLFMTNEMIQEELDFIKSDYSEKCIVNGVKKPLNINLITLFGQDSDGTKYFYDNLGQIFLYCLDPSISNDRIQLISGQTSETFYKHLDLESINDVFELILNTSSLP
ncbi:hypothetical protein ACM5Q9_03245 [Advenella sp. RU8]|jgi:DNA-binding protein Fis|uniref:hypothetical protein n=1 Tax=Advenella sp. RU8 TaxID=3399575 RepID=UPI003AAB8D01